MKTAPRSNMPNWKRLALPLVAGIATAWASEAFAKTFDVREFGAKGDGKALDTPAIQKALDACGKEGGGTVRFAAGTYLSKPIVIKDKTTLQLEAGAMLKATDDPADFKKGASSNYIHFITGKNLTSVAIVGPGTIDGSGAKWWIPAEEARRKVRGYTLPRPNLIVLTGCKNVRMENVTLQNSPKFHFVPTDCDGVVVSNVTILAPPRAANTDAIDPSASRHVLITHCRIDVGDDNIAIKAGKKIDGRDFACEDITVTDCTFLHGHGLSIGSETAGGVRNVTVRNCTFEGTENGIRIKSQRGKGGIVENLTYTDITMKNVDPAITLTCYYQTNSSQDMGQQSTPAEEDSKPMDSTTPVYRNIHIKNLTATCVKSAGMIVGLPESPISNVILENVHITSATTGFLIRNAKGIQLKNTQVTPGQGPAFIVENAKVTGLEKQ
ncbi:MAG TPA: glycoside hydrolase family 28 protein [Verrucomicrobiae bacterium]|nr:glycoside hydrolase family 28 protein [Verrucomicrobiae bacterium]